MVEGSATCRPTRYDCEKPKAEVEGLDTPSYTDYSSAKDFFEAVSSVLVTIACIIALIIGAVCTAIYVVRWPILIGCVMALLLYTS